MNIPEINAASSEINATASATFCATIVDEWARVGVDTAFIAPGSRSTPLVVALLRHPNVDVHIFHDERSASFAAIGHSVTSKTPPVVACSSGTAGAHFYAAVLEASASAVPLLVCTADRPIELTAVDAPQTIDQTKLYGDAVRRFTQPGPPEANQAHWWRSWASQLYADAVGWAGRPGPVHANLAFREPLVGEAGTLPEARTDSPWHQTHPNTVSLPDDELNEIVEAVVAKRGVIVCGHRTAEPDDVLALAEMLGWPVLADHRSGARRPGRSIQHSDLLLRHPGFAQTNQPEVVLRFGEIQTSKAVSQWLDQARAQTYSIVPDQRWIDPERIASHVICDGTFASSIISRLAALPEPVSPTEAYRAAWVDADAVAAHIIDQALGDPAAISEPLVARTVLAEAPPTSVVVVSSSMPVRDVEWFAAPRPDVHVHANRGTNGIDGVLSTAIGAALTGAPTTVLIGDIAFLHDSPALVGLSQRAIDLHIVVVDNDGGGIFSFLPQSTLLTTADFETLFGTPHGTDFVALCQAHGLPTTTWADRQPTATKQPGVRVTLAKTNRDDNRQLHDHLVERVNRALS